MACRVAKGERTVLQTWVASVYGVGESGSTLADPNTGPCWSLLLLFSLSEWRLRLILQPSPTSCTINVLPSAAGGRLTVREQLPPPALQPVSLLPRRKPACVVTRQQSLEKKTKIQSKPCFHFMTYGRKTCCLIDQNNHLQ